MGSVRKSHCHGAPFEGVGCPVCRDPFVVDRRRRRRVFVPRVTLSTDGASGWLGFRGDGWPKRGAKSMTEDVVAIQQLLHRYCFAVDSGTPDETASLFHETA